MSEQTQNHKADLNGLNPALYVSTYRKYNSGILNGGWVDITSFSNGDEFMKYCVTELHKDEDDPELMFQDHQNFPEYLYGESMSSKEIDEILEWWKNENAEREQEAMIDLKVVDYNEGVSIAIVGDTYPIRKTLKEMGGKWMKFGKVGPCWVFSAKKREEIEAFVKSGKATASTEKKEKTENFDAPDKALLEEYLNEERKLWPNDESMIEYHRKQTSRVIRLTNGGLMAFEKPRIETSFCFGYGCQSSTYEEASKAAENAATEKYFMGKNLDPLDRGIKAMAGELEDDYHYGYMKPYLYRKTYHELKLNVFEFQWMRPYDVENEPWKTKGYAELALLSDDDRKLILEALRAERAAFEKRLKTWWKRYGVEKLKIWTYWADA